MSDLQVLYDGDCPFCSQYVTMTRLRAAVGQVELIDARSAHPLVAQAKAQGYDLNEGMLAHYQGRDYFGADCVHLLSMLSSRSGVANAAVSTLFRNKTLARGMYPILRFGRNMTLRAMGRKAIT